MSARIVNLPLWGRNGVPPGRLPELNLRGREDSDRISLHDSGRFPDTVIIVKVWASRAAMLCGYEMARRASNSPGWKPLTPTN